MDQSIYQLILTPLLIFYSNLSIWLLYNNNWLINEANNEISDYLDTNMKALTSKDEGDQSQDPATTTEHHTWQNDGGSEVDVGSVSQMNDLNNSGRSGILLLVIDRSLLVVRVSRDLWVDVLLLATWIIHFSQSLVSYL